jgi:hypothetical protein
MNVEFVNAYIERLVKEVQEGTKTRLLLETQISMMEKANADLLAKVDKYEKAEEKTAKKSKKEVDTSEQF